jgi:hypothetical protein
MARLSLIIFLIIAAPHADAIDFIANLARTFVGTAVGNFVAQAFVAVATSYVLSAVSSYFAPKSKESTGSGSRGATTSSLRDRQVMVKSTIEPHSIVYGRAVISGPIVYATTTGTGNKLLHLVIALAGHEVDRIGDIWLNDERLTVDGSGNVSGGGTYGATTTNKQATEIKAGTIGAGSYYYVTVNQAATFVATVQLLLIVDGKTRVLTEAPLSKDLSDYAEPYLYYHKVSPGVYRFSDGGARSITYTYTQSTAAFVRVYKHLGSPTQVADPVLDAAVTAWTPDHRLQGVAYLYVQLTFDINKFPSGIPNIKAEVWGKKLYDPRAATKTISLSSTGDPGVFETTTAHGLTAGQRVFIRDHAGAVPSVEGEYVVNTTPASDEFTLLGAGDTPLELTTGGTGGTLSVMSWSDNWALIVRDYLASQHGLAATCDEIDDASVIASANICDERVAMATYSETFTAATSDILTFTDRESRFATGDAVTVSSTGTLPGGLVAATNYYPIRISETTTKLASSYANALAGVAINITSAGSGTHTMHHVNQVRYSCNGAFKLDAKPIDIMEQLVTAAAGACPYTQGQYKVHAAAYRAPTITLTASDVAGQIEVQPRVPRKDLYNGVKGTYAEPNKGWQPSDFPVVKNATYAEADQEEIITDIQLPYVISQVAAQRIAKIYLERSRQSISVRFAAKMTAFNLSIWDTVSVTFAQLGWASKVFLVTGWELQADGRGVMLSLQEEASGVYAWNSGDATVTDLAPDTDLPNLFSQDVPTAFAVSSGADEVLVAGDGTIVPRLYATWEAPDGYLAGYEVQYKLSTNESWLPWEVITDAGRLSTYVYPVIDDEYYDVRIRAFNVRNVSSEWVELFGIEAGGLTDPSPDVTGFYAAQNGAVVLFQWRQVVSKPLAGYDIRFNPAGNNNWDDATPVTGITRGTSITTAKVPPGNWLFLIKARDTAGNPSGIAGEYTLNVVGTNTMLNTRTESELWETGTLTNYVIHGPTRKLVPTSLSLANTWDDWTLFDEAVPDPSLTQEYEAPEQDLGIDGTVRAYGEVVSALLPGETGIANTDAFIDSKRSAGAYGGFVEWGIGYFIARYIKQKFTAAVADGLQCISEYSPSVDAERRTEEASNVVVPPGGLTITFTDEFFLQPSITAAVVSATAATYTITAQSMADFTIKVFNSAGTDIGGTINWQAKGV